MPLFVLIISGACFQVIAAVEDEKLPCIDLRSDYSIKSFQQAESEKHGMHGDRTMHAGYRMSLIACLHELRVLANWTRSGCGRIMTFISRRLRRMAYTWTE